ncbi:hypothetical protein SAMD00019534_046170, partial [Acytostelium subglobosum LB1]|uniref:hypothetical protein n=1 Tax=Acytostelium subglobosum LB1 TaxID=1410327 RepID=UPI0006449C4A
MVKIIDGSIVNDIVTKQFNGTSYMINNNNQPQQQQQQLLMQPQSDPATTTNTNNTNSQSDVPTLRLLVDALETSTFIYSFNVKLKYVLAVSLAASILFGSMGLLSFLLLVYIGTLYNGGNSTMSSSNITDKDQSSPISEKRAIPTIPEPASPKESEYSPPAYHVYSSPTLRRSSPNVNCFSPNSGRRLGSSSDNNATV